MTTQTAHVTWLTPEEGGRRSPPSGPRYVAPARFTGGADTSACGDWSLVLELVSRLPDSPDWIANVRFLVDDAPQHWLREGACFELYEGRKRVAVGTVPAHVAEAGGAANVANAAAGPAAKTTNA